MAPQLAGLRLMSLKVDQDALLSLFLSSTEKVDGHVLANYNVSGPRYTSYPTVPLWSESFDSEAFETSLKQGLQEEATDQRPLSLYVHLPFCEERCLFCSCNTVITKQREHADRYLDYLEKEISLVAPHVATKKRSVVQLHWGGGTPTYHTPEQLERVFGMLKQRFYFDEQAEISLEVDPRVTTPQHLKSLHRLGFNRISLGLQDTEKKVQESVNRVQSIEQTYALIEESRQLGFSGINLDLIYGLPYQTLHSFEKTLDAVLELNPDRLALYNFAFVPWLSPWQNQMPVEAMPSGEEKFTIFKMAIIKLLEAGYYYIGMDHFAKPTDELSHALQEGTLHRNFMGYTTRAGNADLLGFGLSAISAQEGAFSQNIKKLSRYEAMLDGGQLPTWRGYTLTPDDKLRRKLIVSLLCQGQLIFSDFTGLLAGESFANYFATELRQLKQAEDSGLVSLSPEGLKLLPLGRMFARNVAMVFDAHLAKQRAEAGEKPLFSKTL
jgi:oxygen-independent coproporphyrinogen III oxidase